MNEGWQVGGAALVSAGIYLALMLGVGIWSLGRTRDPRDFFLAGQRPGLWTISLATMASAFSGFVFIGGPGLTLRLGTTSLMILAPLGFTAAALCWTCGGRLRAMAEGGGVLSLPQVVERRFASRAAGAWAATAVLLGSVAYLAAQVLALGVVAENIFAFDRYFGPWARPAALALGVAVVGFYAAAGGMRAAVATDVIQGLLMLVTAAGVTVFALRATGGVGPALGAIEASARFGKDFLDPLGGHRAQTAFGFFFLFGVGTLGQPHLLHKFFMLRQARDLRWMPLTVGLSQSLCVVVWMAVGLGVAALVAGGAMALPTDPDAAAPAFLAGFTPPWMAGLALAGVLAAVMSSADSLVNLGTAALVWDLPRLVGRRPRRVLVRGRLVTVGLMVAAGVLAGLVGDLVALVGTFAFGVFAASLAPVMALGLGWRRVGARAACLSMGTGLVLAVGLETAARLGGVDGLARWGLPAGTVPGAVALAASLAVLVVAAALGPGADPGPPEPSAPVG
ncbi:MAG: hypothetical protein Q9Q40_06985 [Acidobacteriota bacterium]|nr:hypothetical protein [Acidobacteriota bacterium]MDQ7088252.1 hypothetical protein [Acidobacteriota bacterium]